MSDRSDVKRCFGPGDREEFQRLLDKFFAGLDEWHDAVEKLKAQVQAGSVDAVKGIGGVGLAGARTYNRSSALLRFLGLK